MIADGTYNFAFSPGLEGDRESARTMFRQSMEMFERLGDPRGEADSMWALSLIARLDGDLPRALSYAEGSVRRHRALGDGFGLVDSLHELGRAAYATGDLETARASFLESLEILGPIGYRTAIAIVLDNLAAQETEPGPPRSGAAASRCVGGSQGVVGRPASGRVRRSARPSRDASRRDERAADRRGVGARQSHDLGGVARLRGFASGLTGSDVAWMLIVSPTRASWSPRRRRTACDVSGWPSPGSSARSR